MPPGAGSDAFFSFGSDFPQVAQEIIDVARGLRGEIESALGAGGGSIGANMFEGLQAAATRASTESVNQIKAARQQIVEALSQGTPLPAGGLAASIAPEGIGRQLAANILDPLKQLPLTIQSQILPQVEAALGRLSQVQARLTSQVVAGSTSEITRAALAAGRGGELRTALGPITPGLAAGQASFGANSELTRYSQQLTVEFQQAVVAARKFATDLRLNDGKLNDALKIQLNELIAGGSGFGFNASGRMGFVHPDTGIATAFNAKGGQTEQSTADAAYKQAMSAASESLQVFVQELRALVDSTASYASRIDTAQSGLPAYDSAVQQVNDALLMQARAALRASQAGNTLAEAEEEAAATTRRGDGGGGAFGGGGGGGGGGGFGMQGSHNPTGPTDAFMGALFGQGWHAMQGFDANKAVSNLAGTAGVLLRYGGEARVLFGTIGQVKAAFEGFEQYENSIVNLNQALDATGAKQVNLNAAIQAGAQSGIDSAQSIDIGSNAIEAYSTYIQQGADATDVFTESVKQAGIAAVLTGESAKQASQELIAATIGFNLGPQGQSRIQDAVQNAKRNFGGDPAAIQQAVSQAAPDAYLQGMSPEELANVAALIQRDNPTQSGSAVASEMSKLIIRGQNQTFTEAITQANQGGAGINTQADFTDQIEKMSAYYNTLTESQQKYFVNSLGGARAIGGLLPLLRDGTELANKNAQSYAGGGHALELYYEKMATVGGQLRQLGTALHNIITEVGRSGIFLPLGAGIELLKPALDILNDMLRILNALPFHAGQFGVALAEIYGLYKLINAEAVKTVFGRGVGAARAKVASVTGAGAAGAEGEAAAGRDANKAAADAESESISRSTAVKDANVAASEREAGAEVSAAEARRLNAEATLQQQMAMAAAAEEEGALALANERASAADRLATATADAHTAALAEEAAAADAAAAAMERLALSEEAAGQGALFGPAGSTGLRGEGVPTVYRTGATAAEQEKYIGEYDAAGFGSATLRQGRGAFIGTQEVLPPSVVAMPAEKAAREATLMEGAVGQDILPALEGGMFARAMSRGGGLLSRAGGALGGPAGFNMTTILAAGATYEVMKHFADANIGIQRAVDTSDKAQAGAASATTIGALEQSASDLQNAAEGLKHSSGGFFGSIVNALEGDRTGQEANRDREIALAQLDATKRLTDALNVSASQAGGIDLSSKNALDQSVKTLQDTGRSATSIVGGTLDALTGAAAARNAPGAYILPGSVPVAAANLTNAVGTENVINLAAQLHQRAVSATLDSRIEDQAYTHIGTGLGGQLAATAAVTAEHLLKGAGDVATGRAFLHPIQTFKDIFVPDSGADNDPRQKEADQLHALLGSKDFKTTSDAINKGITDELNNRGFAAGGEIDPAELARLKSIAEQKLRDAPWFKKLPKDVQTALLAGADAAVTQDANSLNLDNPANITPATVDEAAKLGLQNIPNAAAEAGAAASLAGTGNKDVVTAQTQLSDLEAYRSALAANGASAAELQQYDVAIINAKLQLQQAMESQIAAMGALAESLISPFDKAGRIASEISTVSQELAAATDPSDVANYQAKLNDLKAQQAQQAIADVNSAVAAAANPYNTTSQAAAAVTEAQNTLDAIVASGVTSGQDYNDAVKGVADAKKSYADTALADAQQLVESSTVFGDQGQLALQQAADLNQQADVLASKNGDPGKVAALRRQAQQAQAQGLQWQAQARLAYAQSQLDPRDLVDLAQAQLTGDQALFAATPKGDLLARSQLAQKIKQDRLDIAKTQNDVANAQLEAGVFPGSQLEHASARLQEAKNNLALDLKGSAQYYNDLAALHQAQIDLANAQIEANDVARKLTIDLTDPVAVARDAVQNAQDQLNKHLSEGAPRDVLNNDRLNLMQATNQAERTAFEQRLQDAQTNAELGRTSYAAYVSYLESEHDRLVAIQHRTRQQQEELNEVDQALKSVASAAGGQFNLGQITLPTVYQARRQLAIATGTGVYDENPVATGGSFGVSSDPAVAAATSVLDPVAQSIHSLSPMATAANHSLKELAVTLGVIAEFQHGGGKGGAVNITVNGHDLNAAYNMLSSIFGTSALGSRAANTNRKA